MKWSHSYVKNIYLDFFSKSTSLLFIKKKKKKKKKKKTRPLKTFLTYEWLFFIVQDR